MIKQIELHNFKSFTSQSLPLMPLTMFSGLNGMGKSTLLQSLLLLRQSFVDKSHKRGLVLNGELINIGTASDALSEAAEEDFISFELGWEDGQKAHWKYKYNRDADVLATVSDPVAKATYSKSLFNDDFQYLEAERSGPRTSFPMSDYLVRHHRQLGAKGQYTPHFLNTYGSEIVADPLLSHPKAKGNQVNNLVEAWLSEVSPGTRIHLTPSPTMDIVNLEYSFVSPGQVSKRFRATNVGFGLTYSLPVLTALLGSKPGSLVLLENPEAHLHPKGQFKIGELIARAAASGRQILFETHSDHVLNGIRLAVHGGIIKPEDVGLYFFDRPMGTTQVVNPKMDRNGRINHWPENFFDEWDRSLEALLEPPGEQP